MKEQKTIIWERILAVVLCVAMLMGTMPSGAFTSKAASDGHDDVYTVKVTDAGTGAVIPNASIEWSIYDSEDAVIPQETGTGTTGEDGVYEFVRVNEILADKGNVYMEITGVSVFDYVIYSDTDRTTLGIDNAADEKLVSLQEKTADTTFAFEKPTPDDIPYGTSFENKASSVDNADKNDTVQYKITAGNDYAQVDPATGVLTPKATGAVTVEASIEAGDTIKGATASYSVTIVAAEDSGFQFPKEKEEIVYAENATFERIAEGGSGTGEVTYEIDLPQSEEGVAQIQDPKSGVLTILKPGKVTVAATRATDGNYKEIKASYELTVKKAQQTDFAFSQNAYTSRAYSVMPYDMPETEGGQTQGELSYVITKGNDVAEIITEADSPDTPEVEKGVKIRPLKAGVFMLEVTKAGDDYYEPATISREITVTEADQTEFGFSTALPTEVTYNELENNELLCEATGSQTGKTVTYEITEGKNVAEIADPTIPKLKIKEAGTVTVEATSPGNDQYKEAKATYTLLVKRAEQSGFGFSTALPTEVTYNELENNELLCEATGGQTGETVTYEITEGKHVAEIADSVNPTLKIKAAGTVTIEATRPGNELYKDAKATYTLQIHKADQAIEFADGREISLIYGEKGASYRNAAQVIVDASKPDKKGYGTGAITYTIEGANPLGASLDSATGKLTFQTGKIGEIKMKARKAADACYNACQAEYTLKVAYLAAPSNPYTLSGEKLNDSRWFTGDIHIQAPKGYKISYSNDFTEKNWKTEVLYTTEKIGKETVYLREEATKGITAAISVNDLRLDKTNPSDLKITYENTIVQKVVGAITLGFYRPEAQVSIEAKEGKSKIASFTYKCVEEGEDASQISGTTVEKDKFDSYKNGIAAFSFSIPAQFKGKLVVEAESESGRKAEKRDTQVLVVDTISPEVSISYSGDLKDTVVKDTPSEIKRDSVTDADENSRFIYSGPVTATLTVDENNFYQDNIAIIVKRDGLKVTDYKQTSWKKGNKGYQRQLILSQDGDYEIRIEYADNSGNTMHFTSEEYDGKEGRKIYRSNLITIDTKKPVISITDPSGKSMNGASFASDQTVVIKITDRNFRPSEVKTVVETKDIQGNEVAFRYSGLITWDSWKQGTDDSWTAKLPCNVDAYYKITIGYTDIAGQKAKQQTTAFLVDTAAPDARNMTVTYGQELKAWQKISQAVTFHYFSYQDDVTVTLKAEDLTSGVDHFTWTYEREEGASDTKNVASKTAVIPRSAIRFTEKGKTATASFTLTAAEAEQYRGSISFTATDQIGYTSLPKSDDGRVNIVDNISPTRSVTYTTAKQVVDARTLKTKSVYDYSAEGTNTILYYDGNVTATIRIEEANFYPKDIEVRVNDAEWKNIHWVQDGDIWTGKVTISGDGDYVLTVSYQDRSSNQMVEYTSEKLVIDTIDPKINVTYENQDVKNTVNGIPYYDKAQKAVIQVREHNFRADDIAAMITAKDVAGNTVSVEDYAAYLSQRSSWKKEGDVYTAEVIYEEDANYVFDISYEDLAAHKISDYAEQQFTVDKTAPENLSASYSTSVLEQILESITFGFYDAQMTVTITAEDKTSGINRFVYSFENSFGVSEVNEQLLNEYIPKANISQDGWNFTSAFTISKQELRENNQFNGTISFHAYDYAENTSEKKEARRIVVDNLAPEATVTFSDPIRQENGISYYDGDAEVTVVVNEANFYSEDVVVEVARDGAAQGVAVDWSDNSADVHTGTFTLHEDGDYLISINYTDRSNNRMEEYTSEQLTIDTEIPAITVSNIKVNSANKDEKYGFTITADDINIDSSTFEATLTAVMKNENGVYSTQEVSLGEVKTVEDGKTYMYSVENLDADAIYTLNCSVKDLAENEYLKFYLEDGMEYESVRFSINRNGSVFAVDTNTEELVNNYYVYEVNEDVVIEEVNVDPVEQYAVTLNGEALSENSDYTTVLSNNEGEWSKRTYTIEKELFKEEGAYNIVIESTDQTSTTAYSDVKNLNVSFSVDKTAPVLTISGMKAGGSYQTEQQEVTIVPVDDGGKIQTLQVYAFDSDGNYFENGGSVRFDMSGEELENYLNENDGKVICTIPEGIRQQVQVVCKDYAFHSDGSTNEYREIFKNITVTPSNLIFFYTNKPLIYGGVAGVCAAGGVGIHFLRRRKRKIK